MRVHGAVAGGAPAGASRFTRGWAHPGPLRELQCPSGEVSVPPYIIVGRSRDSDVVLDERTVSGRHVRLAWRDGKILVEDLGSANGTFIRGDRVDQALVRPGDDVRLGNLELPWSHPGLKPFLRHGARGDTVNGVALPGRRFICGACGRRGVMPSGIRHGEVRCGACDARLLVGQARGRAVATMVALSMLVAAVVGGVWAWAGRPNVAIQKAAEQFGFPNATAARSPQESSIRAHTAPKVISALDSTHPLSRNAAVRIAASDEGPFHLEQIARIWTHVRGRWRYVNDPRGGEYFASSSETISNNYAGDCDDFAIVQAAMITAIGGDARIVMMDGNGGGHAYAEACIHESPETAAERLSLHYRRTWDRYLGRQRIQEIHFRSSRDCPVWLNLDWNAGVPGGPYTLETWAVAIYPDGRTETLTPATGQGGIPLPEAPAERHSAQPPP